MRTTFTLQLSAITLIAMLQVSGYAMAQNESVFDTIEQGATDTRQSFENPAAETAPRMSPRMKMAPRVAPRAVPTNPESELYLPGGNVDVETMQTSPQAIITDPYAEPVAEEVHGMHATPAVPGQTYVAPHVMPALPPTCGFLPKLGFHGRLIPGVGMEIVSVNYGGVAHREGLETGDIIVEINGRRIFHEYDYQRALVHAAVYNYGQVSLLVRNIRYRPGCPMNPAFVRVYTQLPSRHVHVYPYGVVAAR